MLYTPKETSPLLLFRLSGGKKASSVDSELFVQVCSMSAGLHWTVAGMGDWFYWSPSAPLCVSSRRGAKWAEQHGLGVVVETVFLGRPVCGALQATSSLVWLAKNPIDCAGCPQPEFRFIKSEIPNNVQKQAQSLHGHSNCNTWCISGFSLPSNNFQYVCFGSLPSNVVPSKQYKKRGGTAGYLYNLVVSH